VIAWCYGELAGMLELDVIEEDEEKWNQTHLRYMQERLDPEWEYV
jgi:hypothetical protein